MDDSFKSRVDKIFGSLQSSQSPSLQQRPPLWSLTDDEVEKREWRRQSSADDGEDTLCSSSFDEFLKGERKNKIGRLSRKKLEDDLYGEDDDDDDDGESSESRGRRRTDDDEDEWEIRNYLGMDPTLDNEEEEDEYDKIAAGRENAGERLYTSDIVDHGSFLNSHNVLQSARNNTGNKEFRANRMAARIRLKEDDEEASKINYHDRSNTVTGKSNVQESDNGCQLRPILKRENNGTGFKPQKRVRFDSSCKIDLEELSGKSEDYPTSTLPMNSQESEGGSLSAENFRAVPDYILHPSRYIRYDFDSSSEVDEESNSQACRDIFKLVPNSKSAESLSELEDAPHDLPKSVTFIPKKKSGIVQLGSNVGENKEEETRETRLPVSIAAGAAQHHEDVVTEDEPETSAADGTAVVHKGGRSYRVKS